jgi:hypothetical protein
MFFQKILNARAAIFLQRCSCRKSGERGCCAGGKGMGRIFIKQTGHGAAMCLQLGQSAQSTANLHLHHTR